PGQDDEAVRGARLDPLLDRRDDVADGADGLERALPGRGAAGEVGEEVVAGPGGLVVRGDDGAQVDEDADGPPSGGSGGGADGGAQLAGPGEVGLPQADDVGERRRGGPLGLLLERQDDRGPLAGAGLGGADELLEEVPELRQCGHLGVPLAARDLDAGPGPALAVELGELGGDGGVRPAQLDAGDEPGAAG